MKKLLFFICGIIMLIGFDSCVCLDALLGPQHPRHHHHHHHRTPPPPPRSHYHYHHHW